MSTTVLLIVLAVCVVAVMAALGYVGWRAYRLFRVASRSARTFSDASVRLTQEAAVAQAKLASIAENQARLAASAESLKVALAKLQVVMDAWQRSVAPLRRLGHYLFGR